VGELPPFQAPTRRLVLTAVWIGGVYFTQPSPIAWVLAGFPPISWAALEAAARWSLKRGHYAASLRLLGVLLFVAPDSARLVLRRGEILFAAGRLAEADIALRKALAQAHRQGHQVRALECLARVLTVKGRYEDAEQAVATALKVMPRRSGLHAARAETLLWQAARPEEALTLVNRAIDYESKTRHQAGPNFFATNWAAQAWALALLGRRDAMEEAVRRALQATDESERPQLAGVHYRLGRAHRAAGEEMAAAKSFETARSADPAGLYGRLAAG
jgi:tetratricopeptide (TPR) repeat protein